MKKLKHLHPVKRYRAAAPASKLFYSSVALLLLIGGLIAWAQYQDYRNEQLLRNISADFAQLETALESELGVEVENKSGCFTTQEKYGSGKTGCFMRIESTVDEVFANEIEAINIVVSNNGSFKNTSQIDSTSFRTYYDGWKCTYGDWPFKGEMLYVECPVSVREGNSKLASELF